MVGFDSMPFTFVLILVNFKNLFVCIIRLLLIPLTSNPDKKHRDFESANIIHSADSQQDLLWLREWPASLSSEGQSSSQ